MHAAAGSVAVSSRQSQTLHLWTHTASMPSSCLCHLRLLQMVASCCVMCQSCPHPA